MQLHVGASVKIRFWHFSMRASSAAEDILAELPVPPENCPPAGVSLAGEGVVGRREYCLAGVEEALDWTKWVTYVSGEIVRKKRPGKKFSDQIAKNFLH